MSRRINLCDTVVENYLDKHPEFTKFYYSKRKVILPGSCSDVAVLCGLRSQVMICQNDLYTNQSAVIGQLLKRVSVKRDMDDRSSRVGAAQQLNDKCTVQYDNLDEKDLFMELIRDISNELDVQRISHKILVNIGILTKADRCSLFLVQGSKHNRILVSKLFDVTPGTSFEDALCDEEIVVSFGVGIAGYTAKTGETINIKNAYQDPRFNCAIDKKTGYKTHSIVCMPIKNYEGQVIGVAQVINKKALDHQFTERDVEVVRNYLTFCGIGLTNAQLFELSVMEYKRNQILLQLAKRIFEEQTSLEKVVHNIMLESRELWHCERCSVLLPDPDVKNDIVFVKAFDLSPEEENVVSSSTCAQFSFNNTIAVFSATTGQTVNIANVYEDDRFSEEVKQSDIMTGFKTKSILCTPIKRESQIIGVCQLINKMNGRPFDENDESLFEAFAIFCGIGIHNTSLYEQTSKLLAKQMVAMEVLSYHARAAPEDVDRLMLLPVPDSDQYHLYDFAFCDFELTDDDTIQASLRMFLDLNVLDLFQVSLKTMMSWLLSVKKNYRAVIYHNWRHAFNVAQTMFAMLTTGKLNEYFTDLEKFALVVACLCHDLDHRGTNNMFQSKIESPLARLYGTSTMEHHHFDHCIMILNSEGNNIFSELSSDDYRKTISYLEHAILSTDLQIYFKKRGEFESIVLESESPNWKGSDHNRAVLRAMMMTACDLSAITKPWPIQQAVAKLVMSEFFEQGDIERTELKSEPMPMMDRKKIDDLPKMQISFIDGICLPVYELMQKVERSLSPLYNGVLCNRTKWQVLDEQENKPFDTGENEITFKSGKKTPSPEQNNNNTTSPDEHLHHSSKTKNSTKKNSSKTCGLL